MMKVLILLILSLLLDSVLIAQEKRISFNKVSPIIQAYINSNYKVASKIKYFQNNSNDSIFIESEFRFKEKQYSLTFYQEILQEEEFGIDFNEIASPTQLLIKSKLHSLFTAYKILECQEVNPQTKSHYEITVKHIAGKSSNFYELLFDKSGTFILKSEIILNPISSQF